jgi:tetratricopeptide (TPR) repeat protein
VETTLRPGLAPKPDEPTPPEDLDLKELSRGVRAELRGLGQSTAEIVGSHLLMAGKLIDEDPELAYSHAEAARRRAPRLPVTREATGETAYAAGHYDVALNEFRALRRMGGRDDYVPAMADCERALGRPQMALKLIKEGLAADPDTATIIELRLVEAGVRHELGQPDEALRLLRTTLEELGSRGSKLARARLRYGYADHLEAAGRVEEAQKWFTTVVALDTQQTTDAAERLAALDGMTIVFDPDDDAGPDPEAGAETDDPGLSDDAGQGPVADDIPGDE